MSGLVLSRLVAASPLTFQSSNVFQPFSKERDMKFLADVADPVTVLGQQVSLLWIVIGAALVVFMQAGFALVETGFTQAKNAAHVVSTNFAIFGLGFIGFYLVGFSFSFGGFSYSAFGMDAPVGSALLGSGDWIFFWKGGWALTGDAITPAAVGFFSNKSANSLVTRADSILPATGPISSLPSLTTSS